MPSSVPTYERAVSYYKYFMENYFPRAPLFPASIEHLTLFIAFCYSNNFSCSTVTTYISILSYIHNMGGFPDFTQNFVIKKSLQGLKKLTSKSDTRLPITFSILKELISSLEFTCSSFFLRILLHAMYLLAFYALLRVGEITHTASGAQNNIPFGDVKFQIGNGLDYPYAFELHLKNFKHNPGKHCHILFIQALKDNFEMCPVRALWEYCKLRGQQEGPLFCFMDGTPVSRQFFTQQLQLSLTFCGRSIENYKGHSFRIGGASYAFENKMPEEQIQLMGRWHSKAYKKYIRVPMFTI